MLRKIDHAARVPAILTQMADTPLEDEGSPLFLPPVDFAPGRLTREVRRFLAVERAEENARLMNLGQEATENVIQNAEAFAFIIRSWFLLPAHAVSDEVLIPICSAGSTLTDAHAQLVRMVQSRDPFRTTKFTRDLRKKQPAIAAVTPFPPPLSARFIIDYHEAIYKNQWFRQRMGCLARRWIRSKMRPGNELDPVTMELAKSPVYVTDWAARRLYTFEASTIYRDSLERLLYNQNLFVHPMLPRNPYTNLPLGIGQIVSIIDQLKSYKKTHWTLEGFRESLYDIQIFQNRFDEPLRHSALKRHFKDEKSPEYRQTLLEFISDEHEYHERPFNRSLYAWALEYEPNHETMIQWRRLCFRYNQIYVLLHDREMIAKMVESDVTGRSEALCGPPILLLRLRDAWYRENLLSKAAAAAAAAAVPAPTDN